MFYASRKQMQEQYETRSLGTSNAFTPGVHFTEDERSHSPPITYSSRLHYTVKSPFFSPRRRWTAIYARPRTGNLFLGEFNSPLLLRSFTNFWTISTATLCTNRLTTSTECHQTWNDENQTKHSVLTVSKKIELVEKIDFAKFVNKVSYWSLLLNPIDGICEKRFIRSFKINLILSVVKCTPCSCKL